MRISTAVSVLVVALILILAGCGGKGEDLNGKLLAAVESGTLNEVTNLLEKGANVDARDDFDRTPLMMASLGGHTRITEVLIKAGADLDATAKYGQTALQFAEERGNSDIVALLLGAGARS
jgi:ankyrin repeat protein